MNKPSKRIEDIFPFSQVLTSVPTVPEKKLGFRHGKIPQVINIAMNIIKKGYAGQGAILLEKRGLNGKKSRGNGQSCPFGDDFS
jgi:hypothetical protein